MPWPAQAKLSVVLLLLQGCHVIWPYGEVARPAADGAREEGGVIGDTAVGDTAVDAPRPVCRGAQFEPPVPVDSVNSSSDDISPSLSRDGLSLFLCSSRPGGVGGADLWVAKRSMISLPFAAPTLVPLVNSVDYDCSPDISDDLLSLYFVSTRGGDFDLWRSTRPDPSVDFGAPESVAEVNSTDVEGQPAISADGLELFFSGTHATLPGQGGLEIFVARRTSADQPFGAIALVPELNSSSHDRVGDLSPDGLEITVVSDRPGGKGGYDLFLASRTSLTATFSTPVNLTALNTSGDEIGGTVADDGLTLYFSRSTGTAGSSDVWAAMRICQ